MKKTMILTALAALSATLCAETPAELELDQVEPI